jgi:hypothetical protein
MIPYPQKANERMERSARGQHIGGVAPLRLLADSTIRKQKVTLPTEKSAKAQAGQSMLTSTWVDVVPVPDFTVFRAFGFSVTCKEFLSRCPS